VNCSGGGEAEHKAFAVLRNILLDGQDGQNEESIE
jgi:hypothetical protein